MIAAIVLAAGRSSRFGGQKLVTPVAGKPLVRWAVERVQSSGVARTVVVIAPDGAPVREALQGLDIELVVTSSPEAGMSGSIRTGVLALPVETVGAIIALGDQPAISPDVVRRLIARFRAGGASIVVPCYAGERGHPVLFGASMFAELGSIAGDRGARDLIAQRPERVAVVDIAGDAPADVDHIGDVAAVERQLVRGG